MMRRFCWLLLWVFALSTAHTASAKPAPARWWPAWSRQETSHAPETQAVFRSIQYLLRARGQKIVVDGVFGAQTENAVKSFQRRNKIVASGKLNNATWEALIIPSKQGSQGDAVRALQTLLRRADYDVPVNGKFGPATRAAVTKFQNVRGLTQDGIAGRLTWCILVDGSVGQPEGH